MYTQRNNYGVLAQVCFSYLENCTAYGKRILDLKCVFNFLYDACSKHLPLELRSRNKCSSCTQRRLEVFFEHFQYKYLSNFSRYRSLSTRFSNTTQYQI